MQPKVYGNLREANEARQALWDTGNVIDMLWRLNELGGEVGEVCNLLKKRDREAAGLPGSRTTREAIMEEIADVIICTDLVMLTADMPAIELAYLSPRAGGMISPDGVMMLAHVGLMCDGFLNAKMGSVRLHAEKLVHRASTTAAFFNNRIEYEIAISKKFNKTSHTVGLPVFLDLHYRIAGNFEDPVTGEKMPGHR